MAEMERVNVVDLGLCYDQSRLSRRTRTDRIIVHNSGTPNDEDLGAREINAVHMRENDWAAIGYHFVIRKDGTVERGRPIWSVGAHAQGHNGDSIGVCVSGNFQIASPTPVQIEELAMLIANLCADYAIPMDRQHILGHREVNATNCPGEILYEMMDEVVGKANYYRYPPDTEEEALDTDTSTIMTDEELALEIARGLVETGVEGNYGTVECSTAGDYPSIGISQWEGDRADALLDRIEGGWRFVDLPYSHLVAMGLTDELKALLDSEEGRAVQLAYLSEDCLEYVKELKMISTLTDARCIIYAGMWCPTSTYVVTRFLANRENRCNYRSLKALRDLFHNEYASDARIQSWYYKGYENRAERTYQYVAAIDLTSAYGEPIYGQGPNGR